MRFLGLLLYDILPLCSLWKEIKPKVLSNKMNESFKRNLWLVLPEMVYVDRVKLGCKSTIQALDRTKAYLKVDYYSYLGLSEDRICIFFPH